MIDKNKSDEGIAKSLKNFKLNNMDNNASSDHCNCRLIKLSSHHSLMFGASTGNDINTIRSSCIDKKVNFKAFISGLIIDSLDRPVTVWMPGFEGRGTY